jgi:hypothetical protein
VAGMSVRRASELVGRDAQYPGEPGRHVHREKPCPLGKAHGREGAACADGQRDLGEASALALAAKGTRRVGLSRHAAYDAAAAEGYKGTRNLEKREMELGAFRLIHS